MPERETLPGADACEISSRWLVDIRTAERVVRAATAFRVQTGRDVWIISGHRTERRQRELTAAGRPTASPELSTHLSCPATGVDVSLGPMPTRAMIAIWGRLAVESGLRWGGGSAVGADGIPSDWPHVDLGPRRQ